MDKKLKNKQNLVEFCENCGKPRSQGSLTSWIFSTRKVGCNCETPLFSNGRTTPTPNKISSFDKVTDSKSKATNRQKAQKPDDFLSSRYKIENLIGVGGMGAVYKAFDHEQDKTFAIKILQSDLAKDPLAVKRFEQESNSVAKLTHPNVVAVYDYGFGSDGAPYIVMDYIDGVGLDTFIKDQAYLDFNTVINLFLKVTDAIEHAHSKNVIHRDIKPSNIMICDPESSSPEIKIVDFGIAKVMPEGDMTTQGITQTGELVGSPSYMSPEQCTGLALDQRSDIYSIGCVIYEALCGKVPFKGDNPIQTILNHINDLPEPIEKRGSSLEIPDSLCYIVMRCLEKHPDDRYQTAKSLHDDLLKVKQGLNFPRILPTKRPKASSSNLFKLSPMLVTILASFGIMAALVAFASNFQELQKDNSQSIQSQWSKYDQKGQKAFDTGNYKSAGQYFETALELAKKNKNESVQLKASLNELMDLKRAEKKYSDANFLKLQISSINKTNNVFTRDIETKLDNVLSSKDAAKNKTDLVNLVNNANDQIASLAEVRNFKVATRILKKAKEVTKNLISSQSVAMVRCLHNTGYIHHEKGNLKEAHENYQKALLLERKILPVEHVHIAKTLLMLARLESQMGGFSSSGIESKLKESLSIYRNIVGPFDQKVGWVRFHLALLYFQTGKMDKAKSEVLATLTNFESSKQVKPAKIARCYALLANITKEEDKFKKAISIFESQVNKDYPFLLSSLTDYAELIAPSKPKLAISLINRALALTYHLGLSDQSKQKYRLYLLQGKIEFENGDLAKCKFAYYKANLEAEAGYGVNSIQNFYAYGKLGQLYADLGQFDKSQENYEKAIRILSKLKNRDNTTTRNVLFLYKQLLKKLGDQKKLDKLQQSWAKLLN